MTQIDKPDKGNPQRPKDLHFVARSSLTRILGLQDDDAMLQESVKVVSEILRADLALIYLTIQQEAGAFTSIYSGGLKSPLGNVKEFVDEFGSLLEDLQATGEVRLISPAGKSISNSTDSPGGSLVFESPVQFMNREGVKTLLAIPIRQAWEGRDTITAVVFVGYRRLYKFSENDRRLCSTLSEVASIAFRVIQLNRRAARQEQLSTFSEIHDGMGQYVSISRMLLEQTIAEYERTKVFDAESFQKLVYARGVARALQQQVNYLLELRRESNPSEGLFSAVESYSAIVRDTLNLVCRTKFEGTDTNISSALAHDVQMIVRELVQNAHRHSQATTITIVIRVLESALEVEVSDNGTGFEGDKIRPSGLRNVQHRVDSWSGALQILSPNSPSGTLASIRIPLIGQATSVNSLGNQ